MSGGVLWLTTIVVGIAVVAGFLYYSRRKLTSNRKPIDVAAIHAHVSDEVSLGVFRDVLGKIGQAYSIDPKLIRPEDPLSEFLEADSWTLDAGTEQLNQWLFENGIDEQPTSAVTVLDLARLVENHRQRAD